MSRLNVSMPNIVRPIPASDARAILSTVHYATCKAATR